MSIVITTFIIFSAITKKNILKFLLESALFSVVVWENLQFKTMDEILEYCTIPLEIRELLKLSPYTFTLLYYSTTTSTTCDSTRISWCRLCIAMRITCKGNKDNASREMSIFTMAYLLLISAYKQCRYWLSRQSNLSQTTEIWNFGRHMCWVTLRCIKNAFSKIK